MKLKWLNIEEKMEWNYKENSPLTILIEAWNEFRRKNIWFQLKIAEFGSKMLERMLRPVIFHNTIQDIAMVWMKWIGKIHTFLSICIYLLYFGHENKIPVRKIKSIDIWCLSTDKFIHLSNVLIMMVNETDFLQM